MQLYTIIERDSLTEDVLSVAITTEPRRSLDGTKLIIKFNAVDGLVPLEIAKLATPLYTREEILPLLTGSTWSDPQQLGQ